MAFYRLRLRLLARGPMGVRHSHSLRLWKPSVNCAYSTIISEKYRLHQCLSPRRCGFESWRCESGYSSSERCCLCMTTGGGGLLLLQLTQRPPLSVCKSASSLCPATNKGEKPHEPTQLEMAGSIQGECFPFLGTFLPCVSKESTSYFPSCFWRERWSHCSLSSVSTLHLFWMIEILQSGIFGHHVFQLVWIVS